MALVQPRVVCSCPTVSFPALSPRICVRSSNLWTAPAVGTAVSALMWLGNNTACWRILRKATRIRGDNLTKQTARCSRPTYYNAALKTGVSFVCAKRLYSPAPSSHS
jgi:hypothetical protein